MLYIMTQTIESFINRKKPRWERLEGLIQALERRGAKKLSSSDLHDMGRLYREATADLSRLQAFREKDADPEELELYLNELVGRAYGQIYRNPAPTWTSLWFFLRFTFPRAFRETVPWSLVSLGLFFLGFGYGFAGGLLDDALIPLVVPPHLIQQVEKGQVWFDSILAIKPLASSMIMTNNITVGFMAFALGITFGIGTVYVIVFNGLLLGVLAALCYTHALSTPFWSFVLPHGVIELTAILIAGAAGLLLATALIAPGDLPRGMALVQKAKQSGRLALGCIPLLITAGLIEGFFSPAPLSPALKFLAAGCLLLLLLFYLFIPGATKGPSASRRGTVQEFQGKGVREANP
jgi:uncharacterized membrane protein SpoIIM required for sporulation